MLKKTKNNRIVKLRKTRNRNKLVTKRTRKHKYGRKNVKSRIKRGGANNAKNANNANRLCLKEESDDCKKDLFRDFPVLKRKSLIHIYNFISNEKIYGNESELLDREKFNELLEKFKINTLYPDGFIQKELFGYFQSPCTILNGKKFKLKSFDIKDIVYAIKYGTVILILFAMILQKIEDEKKGSEDTRKNKKPNKSICKHNQIHLRHPKKKKFKYISNRCYEFSLDKNQEGNTYYLKMTGFRDYDIIQTYYIKTAKEVKKEDKKSNEINEIDESNDLTFRYSGKKKKTHKKNKENFKITFSRDNDDENNLNNLKYTKMLIFLIDLFNTEIKPELDAFYNTQFVQELYKIYYPEYSLELLEIFIIKTLSKRNEEATEDLKYFQKLNKMLKPLNILNHTVCHDSYVVKTSAASDVAPNRIVYHKDTGVIYKLVYEEDGPYITNKSSYIPSEIDKINENDYPTLSKTDKVIGIYDNKKYTVSSVSNGVLKLKNEDGQIEQEVTIYDNYKRIHSNLSDTDKGNDNDGECNKSLGEDVSENQLVYLDNDIKIDNDLIKSGEILYLTTKNDKECKYDLETITKEEESKKVVLDYNDAKLTPVKKGDIVYAIEDIKGKHTGKDVNFKIGDKFNITGVIPETKVLLLKLQKQKNGETSKSNSDNSDEYTINTYYFSYKDPFTVSSFVYAKDDFQKLIFKIKSIDNDNDNVEITDESITKKIGKGELLALKVGDKITAVADAPTDVADAPTDVADAPTDVADAPDYKFKADDIFIVSSIPDPDSNEPDFLINVKKSKNEEEEEEVPYNYFKLSRQNPNESSSDT